MNTVRRELSFLNLNRCVIGAKKSRQLPPITNLLYLLSLILLYGVVFCCLLVFLVIRLVVRSLVMLGVSCLGGRGIGK